MFYCVSELYYCSYYALNQNKPTDIKWSAQKTWFLKKNKRAYCVLEPNTSNIPPHKAVFMTGLLLQYSSLSDHICLHPQIGHIEGQPERKGVFPMSFVHILSDWHDDVLHRLPLAMGHTWLSCWIQCKFYENGITVGITSSSLKTDCK